MKKLTIIFFIIVLFGCATTKPIISQGETPSWLNNPYSEYSEDDYILFVGRGSSFKNAKNQALRSSKKYNEFVEIELLEEFYNEVKGYFLLFKIERTVLEQKLKKKWDINTNRYLKEVDKGDSTSNILKKYSFYKNSIAIYSEFESINSIDPDINFIISEQIKEDHSFLVESFNFTAKELEFSVQVTGDIDDLIKSAIEEELHKQGYTTSDNGLVQFNAVLTLNTADLNNDYINKYWSITMSLSDYDGYKSKSINFKGRESQISDEALNQSIARSVVKLVKKSLNKMLP